MNVTGIVAEYNPMHMGHLRHLELCRKFAGSDVIVAVLSGNFVQRGEPAVLDKWTRARLALNNGVDLVIELPVVYSVSSAEFFGFGAVSILNSLGIVNNICFGAENADTDYMLKIADILVSEPDEYKAALKIYLNKGQSFSAARNLALNDYLKDDVSGFINNSNNILGIEYCKSIIKLKSSISPVAVKRQGSSYNEKDLGSLSSATSIRKYIDTHNNLEELKLHVPIDVYNALNSVKISKDKMLHCIKYKYYTSIDSLNKIPDVIEGIDRRISKSIIKCGDYQELVSDVKTKRYAYSRISRILCQYFIGFDSYDTGDLRKKPAEYARILGFNRKGADILRKAASSSAIPLVTKVKKGRYQGLDMDIQATNAYSLLNSEVKFNQDFYSSPVII